MHSNRGSSNAAVLLQFFLGTGGFVTLLLMIIFTLARKKGPTEEAPREQGPVLSGVARGEQVFGQICWACHGTRGVGGIPNENYIKDTIPALNVLAERMKIASKADADRVIAFLKGEIDEAQLKESLEDSNAAVVLAQVDALQKVIQNGSVPGKKDPNGPLPPRVMASWKNVFSQQEIRWILAYLISLYEWDEEEE